ncbi:LysR family transcriptional regulator [Tabrizicola oligotrophica]|uniref:LysR family transcriptional regulator n=1 Tax=Tabrizicola oligotrophica TaxID=2710650 RepID=A0A6M0QPF8_9RHOB|nr:LysR family transcriptional regulator [Tabrizicola oligotrophica]NEY88981.1 LysR family transcriptional regulator [Tabrizicola oligotrophica]
MSLTLKHLRYFIAAAETGQISHAAMEMNISQSAVTAGIQGLEATLGARLLARRAQGVSVTPQGARFLLRAKAIIAAVEEATRSPLGEDSEVTGQLRLGLTYTVAGYFMARHYAAFRRIYPGITLELSEQPRSAIENALVGGGLDMALMLTSNLANVGDLASETLFRSRRRLWLPSEHRLLAAPEIPLADVAREPYVMLTVDEAGHTAGRYWEHYRLTPKVVFATSSVEAVRSMVAAGMGVTILSDMVYRPWSLEGQRIEQRQTVEAIPSMDVGLTWPNARPLSAPAQVFRTFLSAALGAGS